jgi:hypothetical protein
MKTIWIVERFYMGQMDSAERFATREEAMEYFQSAANGCRYGLVGWSVSYPRQEAA